MTVSVSSSTGVLELAYPPTKYSRQTPASIKSSYRLRMLQTVYKQETETPLYEVFSGPHRPLTDVHPGMPGTAVFHFVPCGRHLPAGSYEVRLRIYATRRDWKLQQEGKSEEVQRSIDDNLGIIKLGESVWRFHIRGDLSGCTFRPSDDALGVRLHFNKKLAYFDLNAVDSNKHDLLAGDVDEKTLKDLTAGVEVKLRSSEYRDLRAQATLVIEDGEMEVKQGEDEKRSHATAPSKVKLFYLRDLVVTVTGGRAYSCVEPLRASLKTEKRGSFEVDVIDVLILPGLVKYLSLSSQAAFTKTNYSAAFSSWSQQPPLGQNVQAQQLSIQGLSSTLVNGESLSNLSIFLQDAQRHWTSTEAQDGDEWGDVQLHVYAQLLEQPMQSADLQLDYSRMIALHNNASIGCHIVNIDSDGTEEYVHGFSINKLPVSIAESVLGSRQGSAHLLLHFVPFSGEEGRRRAVSALKGIHSLRHYVLVKSRQQISAVVAVDDTQSTYECQPGKQLVLRLRVKDECGLTMTADNVRSKLTQLSLQRDVRHTHSIVVPAVDYITQPTDDLAVFVVRYTMPEYLGHLEQQYSCCLTLHTNEPPAAAIPYHFKLVVRTVPISLQLSHKELDVKCGHPLKIAATLIALQDQYNNTLPTSSVPWRQARLVFRVRIGGDSGSASPISLSVGEVVSQLPHGPHECKLLLPLRPHSEAAEAGEGGRQSTSELSEAIKLNIHSGPPHHFARQDGSTCVIPAIGHSSIRLQSYDQHGHACIAERDVNVQVKLSTGKIAKEGQLVAAAECVLRKGESVMETKPLCFVADQPTQDTDAQFELTWSGGGGCQVPVKLEAVKDIVTAITLPDTPLVAIAGQSFHLEHVQLSTSGSLAELSRTDMALIRGNVSGKVADSLGEAIPFRSFDEEKDHNIDALTVHRQLPVITQAGTYTLFVAWYPHSAALQDAQLPAVTAEKQLIVRAAAAQRAVYAISDNESVLRLHAQQAQLTQKQTRASAGQPQPTALVVTITWLDEYGNAVDLQQPPITISEVQIAIADLTTSTLAGKQPTPPCTATVRPSGVPRAGAQQQSDSSWHGLRFHYDQLLVNKAGALELHGLAVEPVSQACQDGSPPDACYVIVTVPALMRAESARVAVLLTDDARTAKLTELTQNLVLRRRERDRVTNKIRAQQKKRENEQKSQEAKIAQLESQCGEAGWEGAESVTAFEQRCEVLFEAAQSRAGNFNHPRPVQDAEEKACRLTADGYVGRLMDELEADSPELASLLSFHFYQALTTSYFQTLISPGRSKLDIWQKKKGLCHMVAAINKIKGAPRVPHRHPPHSSADEPQRALLEQLWAEMRACWLTSEVRLLNAVSPMHKAYMQWFGDLVLVRSSYRMQPEEEKSSPPAVEAVPDSLVGQYLELLDQCGLDMPAVVELDTFEHWHSDGSKISRKVTDSMKEKSNSKGTVRVSKVEVTKWQTNLTCAQQLIDAYSERDKPAQQQTQISQYEAEETKLIDEIAELEKQQKELDMEENMRQQRHDSLTARQQQLSPLSPPTSSQRNQPPAQPARFESDMFDDEDQPV